MNDINQEGIVCILTNPAMPGLVKIGKTARCFIDARLSELYSTGVPVPFECAMQQKYLIKPLWKKRPTDTQARNIRIPQKRLARVTLKGSNPAGCQFDSRHS